MRESSGPEPIFYGWYIVAVAFIANFMSTGTGFYAFNAFLEPLCQAHGWTRTQVNMALVISTPFGFLGQFIYGTLIMRLGIKKLMMAGSLLGGVAFILLFQTSSLGLFYFFYVLLFFGNYAYGGIVANSAVNNWFIKKKGAALGIATSGISFSGAVLPIIAMALIFRMGMTGASVCLGAMVIALAPLFWLVVVDWPEKRGLFPDGGSSDPASAGKYSYPDPPPSAVGVTGAVPLPADGGRNRQTYWTLARLIRVPAFWQLGLAYAMAMMGVVGVMSQLKPRFVDVGFSDSTAMILMTVTAFVGAVGKYIWGVLCDSINPTRVVSAIMIANAVGLVAALAAHSAVAIGVFILLFGFAMGGVMATYPIIVADLFGRESFTAVFRFMAVFLVMQMAGYIIAGASFDLTGSYNRAYGIFIGLDLIAAVIVFSVRRPVL
ncbi:MAG: MFS transporter [Thermodesulfobacteriota bacterium]